MLFFIFLFLFIHPPSVQPSVLTCIVHSSIHSVSPMYCANMFRLHNALDAKSSLITITTLIVTTVSIPGEEQEVHHQPLPQLC
jgi:hypothetical protein